MDINKAFQHFLEKEAGEEYQSSLLALDKYYHDNRQQLVEDFRIAFITFFQKISQAQSESKQNIAYIYASFLYTSLQEGQGMYRLDAYDKEWFVDLAECAADYNARWAYGFLHELCERLNQKCKKYAGKITRYDIELLMRMESCKFDAYVEAVAREAVKAAVRSPEFAAIGKEAVLQIFIGEYKDQCRTIYCHDSRIKDSVAITEEITEKPADSYDFAVWEQLDFNNIKFNKAELRYARFTSSAITNSSFDQALLWGADFNCAKLCNTYFTDCEMPGADFGQAQLSESRFERVDAVGCGLERVPYIGTKPPANFEKAELKQVRFEAANLDQVSFEKAVLIENNFSRCDMLGSNFQGATLKNCTFFYVDLREADFCGADITDCDFSTSDLTGAIFSAGTNLAKLGLTEQQVILK